MNKLKKKNNPNNLNKIKLLLRSSIRGELDIQMLRKSIMIKLEKERVDICENIYRVLK